MTFSRVVKRVSAGALVVCVSALLYAGCSPVELPGLKQWAEYESARMTRETQEAIKKSPTFQELDRLCTKDIPLPSDFRVVALNRSRPGETYLSYSYHSDIKYEPLKAMYLEYFRGRGWRLAEQHDRGWGPPFIDFRNENYRFVITYFGPGSRDNYNFHCAKLSPAK